MPFTSLIWILLVAGFYEGPGNLDEVVTSWSLGKGGWQFSFLSSRIDVGPWGWLGEKGNETFISADFGSAFLYCWRKSISFSIYVPFKWDHSIGSEKDFSYERSISDPVVSTIISGELGKRTNVGFKGFLIPPIFKRFESPLRKFSTGTWNLGGIFLLDYLPTPRFSFHFNLGTYNWDLDDKHGAGSDQVSIGSGINFHYGNFHPFLEFNYRWFIFQDLIYHQPKMVYGGSPLKLSMGIWGKLKEKLKWNMSFGVYLTRREIDGATPESLSVLPSRDISASFSFGIHIENRKIPLPFELGEWKLFVSDEETGKPLFAEVEISPTQEILSTDRGGKLVLKSLTPGLYTLRIKSEEYEPKTAYLMVKPGEKGEIRVRLKKVPKRGILIVTVKNFLTEEYLPATISVVGGKERVETKGKATLKLLPGIWEIRVESPGYRRVTYKVEIMEEVESSLDLYLLPEGEDFFLFPIYFDYKSTVIQPQYFPPLERIARIVKIYPDLKIEISGHTCKEGSEKFSLLLSERRAEVLRDYFLEVYNISMDRIETIGYGDRRPVAPTKTTSGRLKNRRADVKLFFE